MTFIFLDFQNFLLNRETLSNIWPLGNPFPTCSVPWKGKTPGTLSNMLVPGNPFPETLFRETLSDIPVYASVSDRYLWIDAIKNMSQVKTDASGIQHFQPPTWADHFKIVLSLI